LLCVSDSKKGDAEENPPFIILGTSHEIQREGGAPDASARAHIDGLRSIICQIAGARHVALIAEEAPYSSPSIPTVTHEVAEQRGVSYIQVDMSDPELAAAGICPEKQARLRTLPDLDKYCADELRFPRADDMRENFWLDKIKDAGAKPVLVVCGWAHVRALSKKIRERYGEDAQEMFFPERFGQWKIAELFLDDAGTVHTCGRPE
jgi:hypothetical protein